jgi:hypothetical protein
MKDQKEDLMTEEQWERFAWATEVLAYQGKWKKVYEVGCKWEKFLANR